MVEEHPGEGGGQGSLLAAMLRPRQFFRDPSRRARPGPLATYLLSWVAGTLGGSVLFFYQYRPSTSFIVSSVVFVTLLLPLPWLYAYGALLHMLVGRGGARLSTTIEAIEYSSAPMLLSVIPFLAFPAVIWSFVVTSVALARVHDRSIWRGALCQLLLVVLMFGVSLKVMFGLWVVVPAKANELFPTVAQQRRIFVWREVYSGVEPSLPRRGDIVLLGDQSADLVALMRSPVGRVIGLPNETIELQGSHLFINGVESRLCDGGQLPSPVSGGSELPIAVADLEGRRHLVQFEGWDRGSKETHHLGEGQVLVLDDWRGRRRSRHDAAKVVFLDQIRGKAVLVERTDGVWVDPDDTAALVPDAKRRKPIERCLKAMSTSDAVTEPKAATQTLPSQPALPQPAPSKSEPSPPEPESAVVLKPGSAILVSPEGRAALEPKSVPPPLHFDLYLIDDHQLRHLSDTGSVGLGSDRWSAPSSMGKWGKGVLVIDEGDLYSVNEKGERQLLHHGLAKDATLAVSGNRAWTISQGELGNLLPNGLLRTQPMTVRGVRSFVSCSSGLALATANGLHVMSGTEEAPAFGGAFAGNIAMTTPSEAPLVLHSSKLWVMDLRFKTSTQLGQRTFPDAVAVASSNQRVFVASPKKLVEVRSANEVSEVATFTQLQLMAP